MPQLLLFAVLCLGFLNVQAEATITPSEVYGQVLLIEKETELVKHHFNYAKQPIAVAEVNANIMPRHVWQKCYMLQKKLVAFRRKHQLDALTPVEIEPVKDMDPRYTWAQTQRILVEIRIIRMLLGISGEAGAALPVEGKVPLDVFNKLSQIEAEWDALTGADFDASYAFGQAMRLNEEVDVILRHLGLFDDAIPPEKNVTAIPANSLTQIFLVLEQLQRLKKLAGLDIADLSAFRKTEQITAYDVFNMICLTLAELQPLKYQIGLRHVVTVPANHYENKTPADVLQLLGYVTNKLVLIQHL